MIAPGSRIGALWTVYKHRATIFGFGTYQGDEIPPAGVFSQFGPADLLRVPIAKLVMDDGTVVWGCECHWTTEWGVKEEIAGRKVFKARIEVLRRIAARNWERAGANLDQAEAQLP